MSEKSSKEWRKKGRLTDKELQNLIEHINGNMANYRNDIKLRMEISDKIELERACNQTPIGKDDEELEC